jgi:hypothetical protein
MATTSNTYTGNGSNKLFSITFPYLETTDIFVFVNGTPTTAYTFANATTIEMTTAPANGATVYIARATNDTALQATFFPGSSIKAADLNLDFDQVLYIAQETTNEAQAATFSSNAATTTANTALSQSAAAVSTANTASSNASAAVSTANTASTNASNAVTTANTASSNATTAVNTANAATSTANSAASDASTALSTANTALTNANSAVTTANTASSNATAAVSTANTASTNASNAVTTANSAVTTANGAVTTANTANTNSNTAITTANAAAAAVANAVLYTTVANVAAIPASPANNAAVEVTNSTGIESFTPLSGLPAGFIGSSGLSVRIIYQTVGATWTWIQYFPNDPEARYFKLAGGTLTGTLASTLGTAALPSLTFTGDTNTGIYSPGADQVAISTNGTGRLFVNNAGQVGLGVSSPATLLHLQKAAGDTDIRLSDGTHYWTAKHATSNNALSFTYDTSERMRITSAGLVGIGTSSPGSIFHAVGNGAIGIFQSTTAGQNAQVNFQTTVGTWSVGQNINLTNTGALEFSYGGIKAVLDSSGRLGIGTTSPSAKLEIAHGNELGIYTNGPYNFQAKFESSDSEAAIVIEDSNSTNDGNRIGVIGDNMAFTTANSERLRITSAGLVGIGTSSVGARFHIEDTDSSSTYSTASILGTQTSVYKQIVHTNQGAGTNEAGIVLRAGTSSNIAEWGISALRTGATSGDLVFRSRTGASTSAEFMRLDSSGRVGIGTSTVNFGAIDHGVHIYGSGAQEGIRLETTNGSTGILEIYAESGGNTLDTRGSGYIRFNSAATEWGRWDSSGRLLVGTSTDLSGGDADAKLQVNGDGGAQVLLSRQDFGALTAGTLIGEVVFRSQASGVSETSAIIKCEADATQGSGDKPGRLVFSTTADGASSPTERMRIQQNGFIKAANNGNYVNTTDAVHRLESDNASNPFLVLRAQNASYSGEGLQIRVNRAANSAYWFLAGQSSDGGDNEFVLKGDGNAFADGSWSGGGADYAEYFEWSDSNPDDEDRRGISVVLDSDKIREAVVGEDPIGVISGNPSVVGDAAWNKWSGKYLRDEFGTYIQEDYEVEGEDGNTVIQQRRKLNPVYDPEAEYIPREQRPEWDCVGLMGKLRIRKGQITGSRWIKMRDINDSVEEWLVR